MSILLILSAGCVNDETSEIKSLIRVGDSLPQFEVLMDDGRTVTTQSLVGQPSVVVLFSIACDDCRRYLPEVEKLHREYPGLAIICIARDGDAASISRYWADNGITVPYSAVPYRDVYDRFATGGVPRTYVSDASLTVMAEWDDSPTPVAGEIARVLQSIGL